MVNKTVSVIIPVYNAKQYLRQCMESVLQQTYENIQVILVDDYSQDDSLEICKYYEKIDKRVSVYVHNQNSGVSHARNSGLVKAVGKYVMFIDADDTVEQNFIQRMVSGIGESDIAACGYIKVGVMDVVINMPAVNFISKDNFLFHVLCSNIIGGYCCNKIFRAELLNGLTFDHSLSIGEDMLFVMQYLGRCEYFCYISEPLYKYRINPNSTMQKMYTNHTFDRKKISNLESAVRIKEILLLESNNINRYSSYRIVRASIWLMFQMLVCQTYENDIGILIKKYIKNEYVSYKSVKYGSIEQKILARVIILSPKLAFYMGHLFFLLFPHKIQSFKT